MVKQRIDPVKIDGKRFVLLMLALFGGGILLLCLSKVLIYVTGIGLFDALFLVGVIAMLIVCVRRVTVGYLYVVEEGTIRLAKSYGDKINTLLEIRPSDLVSITPCAGRENTQAKPRSITRMGPKKALNMCITYRQNGATYAVEIAGSNEIQEAMEGAWRESRKEA